MKQRTAGPFCRCRGAAENHRTSRRLHCTQVPPGEVVGVKHLHAVSEDSLFLQNSCRRLLKIPLHGLHAASLLADVRNQRAFQILRRPEEPLETIEGIVFLFAKIDGGMPLFGAELSRRFNLLPRTKCRLKTDPRFLESRAHRSEAVRIKKMRVLTNAGRSRHEMGKRPNRVKVPDPFRRSRCRQKRERMLQCS